MSISHTGWTIFTTERQHSTYKWMELQRSADFLCREILGITKGEKVTIYADTASDRRVVQATSSAAHCLGAEVVVLWYATNNNCDSPPPEPLRQAILASDMVIEFSAAYLAHSMLWREARVERNIPMKCLSGMSADSFVRTIDPETHFKVVEMEKVFTAIVAEAIDHGRITNRAGTDITFKFAKGAAKAAFLRGYGMSEKTGLFKRGGMLGGQIDLFVDPTTINGKIAFDGCLWPPPEVGAIKNPIEFEITDGMSRITSDHAEAGIMKNWFAHFDTPEAYKMIHINPGFNPGVKRISGDIVEDERLFGCVECGIGVYSEEFPCHTDGVLVNPSLWIDDKLIEKDGVYIEPRLKRLAREMGMQLWTE